MFLRRAEGDDGLTFPDEGLKVRLDDWLVLRLSSTRQASRRLPNCRTR